MNSSTRRGLFKTFSALCVSAFTWRSRAEDPPRLALGNRAHIQVRPHVKELLKKSLADVLDCGDPIILHAPNLTEPILAFRFPGGGSLSFEFSGDAPDEQQARRGAWLEVRTADPAALIDKVSKAGLERLKHPATATFYFVLPGGQVLGIAAIEKS